MASWSMRENLAKHAHWGKKKHDCGVTSVLQEMSLLVPKQKDATLAHF